MSKNRNRAKLDESLTKVEYLRKMKMENVYCVICVRRGGKYTYSCHPSAFNPKGPKWRENRSWKNNRKRQWKEKYG